MTDGENVTRLPYEAPEPPPPSPPRRLHGVAIVGLACSAVAGIALTLALITVRWPSGSRKTLIVMIVMTAVAFMVSAAVAVFAAARDTYPSRGTAREPHAPEQ